MARATTNPGAPIFVVGAPRSGTTLLAAMLAAHSRLSCGAETHFLNQDVPLDATRLCDPARWPGPAVEYLCSIDVLGRSAPELYGFSREQLETYLRARPPSLVAILEALTEQHMTQVGKQRWVEKTPGHCLCVSTIRRLFPASPIVRIVRDPRDVALSLRRVEWGPSSLIECVWKWRAFEVISAPFFETDPHALTLRYEDLVLATEATLRKVCDFIGEEFQAGMADTSQSIRHVNRLGVAFKTKAGTPPDPSRVWSWQRSLTDQENRVSEAVLGIYLRKYGFLCRDDFKGYAAVYPAARSRYYWPALQNFVAEGFRFWPEHPRERPALRVYLGRPDADDWLPGNSLARLWSAAKIGVDLWRARVAGPPVRWFNERPGQAQGLCARLLGRGLRPFSAATAEPAPTPPNTTVAKREADAPV